MADIIENNDNIQEDSYSLFAGMGPYKEGMTVQEEADDAPVPPQVESRGEDKTAAPSQDGAKESEPVKEEKPTEEEDFFKQAAEAEPKESEEVEAQPQRGRRPMTAEDYEARQISALYDVFVEDYGWGDIPQEERPRNAREFCEFVTAAIAQNSTPQYASPELQQLDQYVRQGGKVADYLQSVAEANYDALTINSEQNQKYAVAELLKLQGFPPEKIQQKVEAYAKSGVLEQEATDALAILQGYSQNYRQQTLEQQQRELAQMQEIQHNFLNATSQVLGSMGDIFGIPLTYKDKQELFNYIFEKDQNGNSQYMLDYSSTPEAIIQSAFLTRYGKGVMTRAQRAGEKKAVEKFRDTISQQQMRSKGPTRGSNVKNEKGSDR